MNADEFDAQVLANAEARRAAMIVVMSEAALALVVELAERRKNKLGPKSSQWARIVQIADALNQ